MKKKSAISALAVAIVVLPLVFAVAGCSPDAPDRAVADTGVSKGVIQNVEAQPSTVESNDAQQLANKHLAQNVQCAVCHDGEADPLSAPESGEMCETCHDYENLAQSTEHLADRENRMANPHDSHLGDVDCTLCHSNHGKSQYYCLTCHPEAEYQDISVP